MNPNIISRIRSEASEIVGEGNGHEHCVTYENYKRFTWANAVLLEALRLHPSVPKVSQKPDDMTPVR
jgi:cytochrome P450